MTNVVITGYTRTPFHAAHKGELVRGYKINILIAESTRESLVFLNRNDTNIKKNLLFPRLRTYGILPFKITGISANSEVDVMIFTGFDYKALKIFLK